MAKERQAQRIYGYVDLTPQMRSWIRKEILDNNRMDMAAGWKVLPAHFRENPVKGIIVDGYPDTDESELYWFDNPDKRDVDGEIIREPLPILHDRDKDYFRQENALMKEKYGFYRYVIYESRKKRVREWIPEDPDNFAATKGKHAGIRPNVAADIVESAVQESKGPIQETVPEIPKKAGRPKGSKNKKPRTETRLVEA